MDTENALHVYIIDMTVVNQGKSVAYLCSFFVFFVLDYIGQYSQEFLTHRGLQSRQYLYCSS